VDEDRVLKTLETPWTRKCSRVWFFGTH